MSRDADLERQLRGFGETLRQQVGEPIAPPTASTGLSGRSGIDDGPDGRDRRRWVALVAAAAVVALGIGLLAVVQVDDAPAPVATQPTAPEPTAGPPSSTTTVPPAPSELTSIDHVVLVDGEAVGEAWTTGVANTSDELIALWDELGLQEAVPAVDFTTDVVLYFNPAESGSCRFGPLDDVAHDPTTGRVFPVLPYEDPASDVIDGERVCTSDANPHAILVRIARRDLPSTDFVVWVNNADPPTNFLNRVTRVAAGELLTAPAAPTTTIVDTPGPSRPDQLVAINADGDAVLLSEPSAEPVVLFDGPSQSELDANEQDGPGPNVIDHVSVTPDGSLAFVGTCCEPVSGTYLVTEPPAAATYDGPLWPGQGYNPTVSRDGSLLAVGSIAGVVVVSELATERQLTVENASGIPDDLGGAFTPYDLAWSAPDAFGVLGIFEGDWVIVPGTVVDSDAVVLGQFLRVGSFDGDFDAPFQFAGYRAEGGFLVHRTGDATAQGFGLDGTAAGEVDLGGPTLSAWLEPDEPAVRVDGQGTLTVGELVVSGEYRWARSGSTVR